jgi:hypothetical protein
MNGTAHPLNLPTHHQSWGAEAMARIPPDQPSCRDTESNSLFAYREQVPIQFSTGGFYQDPPHFRPFTAGHSQTRTSEKPSMRRNMTYCA